MAFKSIHVYREQLKHFSFQINGTLLNTYLLSHFWNKSFWCVFEIKLLVYKNDVSAVTNDTEVGRLLQYQVR